MLALALVVLLGAAPGSASAPAPALIDAEVHFANLKAIVGEWEAPVGKDGKIVRASYALVSKGTVLVETWTTPSGASTMTVFHLDGRQLMATHYCAQGNQPRLRWTRTVKGVLSFDFLDATNLASASASHLAKLDLGLAGVDAGRLSRREVYVEGGKEEVTEFVFQRRAGVAK